MNQNRKTDADLVAGSAVPLAPGHRPSQSCDSDSQIVQKLAVCYFLRIISYVAPEDSTHSSSATSVAFAKLAAIVMTRAQDVFAWASGACTRHNLEFAINGLESQ